jgi:hypothetical protein
VAADFIKKYCKVNQRTWFQSERILTKKCATLWNRPIESTTKGEIRKLSGEFASEGYPCKAVSSPRHREEDVGLGGGGGLDQDQCSAWLDHALRAAAPRPMLALPEDGARGNAAFHLDNPDDPKIWVRPFELTKSTK